MIQGILKKVLPKAMFKRIEEESKQWFIECPQCGLSVSYWEMGGVRAYAASKGKRVLGRCPQCKKPKLFKVVKKT